MGAKNGCHVPKVMKNMKIAFLLLTKHENVDLIYSYDMKVSHLGLPSVGLEFKASLFSSLM